MEKPNIIKYATAVVNLNIPELKLSNLGQKALPLELVVFVPFFNSVPHYFATGGDFSSFQFLS